MANTVAFIHTSASMLPVFKPLAEKLLPGVSTFHVVDESLLCDLLREGRVPPGTARRVANQVVSANDAGATHIVVTCSSMGPAVEASRAFVPAKVMRVDEAMVDAALDVGPRVGVVATLPSTLAPTAALVRSTAAKRGINATVDALLVAGAFTAVMSGDGATHDRLVAEAVAKLSADHDVVLLAQASMARAVDAMTPEQKPKPVLASPKLAVARLAQLLK
ncbi:MAG: aspartate/glutamate racemase family protein [Tepidisphaeraceae bacterium]